MDAGRTRDRPDDDEPDRDGPRNGGTNAGLVRVHVEVAPDDVVGRVRGEVIHFVSGDAVPNHHSYSLLTIMTKCDLTQVAPPKELTEEQCTAELQRLERKLAGFRNTAELYAIAEAGADDSRKSTESLDEFVRAMNDWAQQTLKNAWLACREPGGGMSISTQQSRILDI